MDGQIDGRLTDFGMILIYHISEGKMHFNIYGHDKFHAQLS